MILVDTSVWINHLRSGSPHLSHLLDNAQVLAHPFVIGELACGNLAERRLILALLQNLPKAAIAQDQEVLTFIESHHLMGQGIGYIDAHLLAATALEADARLWSDDKKLMGLATAMGRAYEHSQRKRHL